MEIIMKCPNCGNEMKKGIELQLKAESFYCDECMEVFARFKER